MGRGCGWRWRVKTNYILGVRIDNPIDKDYTHVTTCEIIPQNNRTGVREDERDNRALEPLDKMAVAGALFMSLIIGLNNVVDIAV